MRASVLLRSARRKAAMSQRGLAKLAGVPQATVSRIERGVVSPSVDTLEKLLRQCGRELETVERPTGQVDITLIQDRLRLTPGERASLAVREWHETEPFRRLGERARRG